MLTEKKQNVKVSHLTPKPCVSWTTVNEFSPAKTDISERDKCVNDAFLVSEMITLSGSLVELKCEKTYKKFTDSRPKSAMKKVDELHLHSVYTLNTISFPICQKNTMCVA